VSRAHTPKSRLVYSTEGGGAPQPPGHLPASGERPPARGERNRQPDLPRDGVVRIWRDRGGRGGKVVTVIRGLPEGGAVLEARAAELRRLCGAGGTVKGAAVEIQGDHRERVAERLRAQGHTVKLVGG